MKMPLIVLLLLSTAGLADVPRGPSAPQPPDRHRFVAGWQIEDVADPSGEDPYRRSIRMRRQGEDWSVQFEFVEGAVAVSQSRNHEANVAQCSQSHGGPDWGGTAADQARDARADLSRLLAHAQRSCERNSDITAAALTGFDEAFAVALAWDRERIALLAPFRARDDAAGTPGGPAGDDGMTSTAEINASKDDMSMDMNAGADMSMDMNASADDVSTEMNATTDADGNSTDPPK
ncbi:MAG TPA: hypothetical protein VIT38_15845 [Allosphingosinicella sp.]|jgi:hypothetical protein